MIAGFVLYITFPYWLLVFPVGVAFLLARWAYKNGGNLKLALYSSEVDVTTSRLREILICTFLLLGALGIFLCFLIPSNVHLIYMMAGTLAILVLVLHLSMLSKAEPASVRAAELVLLRPAREAETEKARRPFSYYLLKSSREFFVSIFLVVLAFSLVALWLTQIPSDDITLGRLRLFEDTLQRAHVFLESLKFTPVESFVLVAALWCLRFMELRLVGRTVVVDVAWKRLRVPLKVMEKAVLVTATGCCITFLGTGKGGVIEPFSAKIRDLDAEYTDFQREVRSVTDTAIRNSLVERAWRERPAFLTANLRTAVTLIEHTDEYKARAREAALKYQLKESPGGDTRGLPMPEVKEQQRSEISGVKEAPSSLTERIMKRADADLNDFKKAVQKKSPKLESGESLDEELVNKTFEEVEPLEVLENSAFSFRELNEHYPVFGELASTVASAFNDWAFNRIRSHLADRVAAKKLEQPGTRIDTLVNAEIGKAAMEARLEWSFYSKSWSNETTRALSVELRMVVISKRKLFEEAKRKQVEGVTVRAQSVRARIRKLRDLGGALSDRDLRVAAEKMDVALGKLLVEEEHWPPLGPVPAARLTRLDGILNPLRSNWATQRVATYRAYLSHQFPESESDPEANNPLFGVGDSLLDYTHEYLLLTVEESLAGRTNKAIVKQQLGREFDTLEATHNLRVAQEKQRQEAIRREAAKREAARREEVRQREEFRRQQEELRRIERQHEAERAYEHPVP